MEDAEWEIEKINATRSDVTLSSLGSFLPFENKKHLISLRENLRQAGLPE
jgi:hypothetical protein